MLSRIISNIASPQYIHIRASLARYSNEIIRKSRQTSYVIDETVLKRKINPMRNRMIFVSLAFSMIGILDYPAAALADQPPHMSAKIKALTREDDALDDRCRAPGGDANGRACLLRSRILLKLMHLGWCWDSEKMDPIEADNHWMHCSDAHKIP